MFELPEYLTLARQVNETLSGKVIRAGRLGNSPHKFVWYTHAPDEFERLTGGKTIGTARVKGRWMMIPLEPGYVLVVGECGGKFLYHPPGSEPLKKFHLHITFTDGSSLSALTQMWGAYELYESGRELERPYIKGMRPTPVDAEFSREYFLGLIADLLKGEKRSVKSLLTQDQLIPGLGNAIAQDILFTARLHPRRPLAELTPQMRNDLYDAILGIAQKAAALGGRSDELDLYGQPGGYQRILDSKAAGQPCPVCGSAILKMQYLGGASYYCPRCQE